MSWLTESQKDIQAFPQCIYSVSCSCVLRLMQHEMSVKNNLYSTTTIFDKIVGTKLMRSSNYSPCPPYSVEAPNSVSRSLGSPTLRPGWGGNHALLREASALQTQKGEFQCLKIDKITSLQRSSFQILFQLILSKIVDL